MTYAKSKAWRKADSEGQDDPRACLSMKQMIRKTCMVVISVAIVVAIVILDEKADWEDLRWWSNAKIQHDENNDGNDNNDNEDNSDTSSNNGNDDDTDTDKNDDHAHNYNDNDSNIR